MTLAAADADVVVRLASWLHAGAGAAAIETLAQRVGDAAEEIGGALGAPVRTTVRVEPGEADRLITLAIDGRPVEPTWNALLDAWQLVDEESDVPDALVVASSGDSALHGWADASDDRRDARRRLLADVAGEAAAAALRHRPGALVQPGHVASLTAHAPGGLLDRADFAALLDRGVALAPELVDEVLRSHAHNDGARAATWESAFRRMRSNEVELIVAAEDADGLPELQDPDTLSQVAGTAELQLGAPFPTPVLVTDPMLPSGRLGIRINDHVVRRLRALRPGETLMRVPRRKLGVLGLAGRVALDPVTRRHAVVFPAGTPADNSGWPVLTAADLAQHVLLAEMRRWAGALFDVEETALLLSRLEISHPDLVQNAMQRVSIAELAAVMRRLLDEAVPLWNLEAIVGTIVEDELAGEETPGQVILRDHELPATSDARERRVALARLIAADALAPQHRVLGDVATSVFLDLEDDGLRTTDGAIGRLQAGTIEEVRPVAVTRPDARVALRARIATRLHDQPVLSIPEASALRCVELGIEGGPRMGRQAIVTARIEQWILEYYEGCASDRERIVQFQAQDRTVRAEVLGDEDWSVVQLSTLVGSEIAPSPEFFEFVATFWKRPLGRLSVARRDTGNYDVYSDQSLLGETLDVEELIFAATAVTMLADDAGPELAGRFGALLPEPAATPAPAEP